MCDSGKMTVAMLLTDSGKMAYYWGGSRESDSQKEFDQTIMRVGGSWGTRASWLQKDRGGPKAQKDRGGCRRTEVAAEGQRWPEGARTGCMNARFDSRSDKVA